MQVFKKALKWMRNILIFLFASSLFMVVVYKFVPVYYTPLMIIRLCEQFKNGKPFKLDHKWIPINDIPQSLVQAVVASEDNLFMDHSGFDINQIQKAREEAEQGKRIRGASTITQQTAKNVFLWPGKSFVRKGLEAYFTVLIEFIWGKERIMEVYLNSIEMGDGLYGVQAVAKAHFHKNALQLTAAQCALIAASLPNPIKFNSAKPTPYMLRRQAKILSLMGKIIKVEMGHDVKDSDLDKENSTIKKRKKWRASLIQISEQSSIAVL